MWATFGEIQNSRHLHILLLLLLLAYQNKYAKISEVVLPGYVAAHKKQTKLCNSENQIWHTVTTFSPANITNIETRKRINQSN